MTGSHYQLVTGTWLLSVQMNQTPACMRDAASIWGLAFIGSFTVHQYADKNK